MSVADLGTLEEYEHGVARQVKLEGRVLVVVRIEESLYVLDDRCSHEEFSLAEGEVDVETGEIECARHGALFRLSDGEALSLPATKPVAHYEVFAAEGHLMVALP